MKLTEEKKQQILQPLLGVGVILAALVVFLGALYLLTVVVRILFMFF